MLSKNKIKFINSIKKKKYREIHDCFFAEGDKLVEELILSKLNVKEIFATSEWFLKNKNLLSCLEDRSFEISENELNKISSLATPNKVLAIAEIPVYKFVFNSLVSELNIFLESINDPGNLGTIIRIADWFGIDNIFCSSDSVDVYNPKVVQASMGSVFRVKVHYVESIDFFKNLKLLKDYNIYGTFLDGVNVYKEELSNNGLIVMGNESHGISKDIESFIDKRLFIPNFPKDASSPESLNISIATAITCSEFRRRVF